MMEDNKGQMGGQHMGCNCGMCMHGGMHRHGNFLVRIILGLVILLFVFWLGLQVGEFRGSLESGYGSYYGGHHMMMDRGSMGYPIMMQDSGMMTGQNMMQSATPVKK